MSISYAETVPLTCPRCGRDFASEIFILVDAVERPELVARILDDTLHDTRCPQCGQSGRVAAPMLYHDSLHARVLLAVPPAMPESEWHEVGQTLLWTLIGALPETARLPYLGAVQAEAGLAGVAEIIRREQLVGAGDADMPPIALAIGALLTADGPEALLQTLAQHPILQEDQAVTILEQLAAEAGKTGQTEAEGGFRRAAELLQSVKRERATQPITLQLPGQPAPAGIGELATALLAATTGAELAALVDQHPALLDAEADAALAAQIATARGQGQERIAAGLAERAEALRELRAQYQAQQPVLLAVQAYLEAESADEQIVLEREELTTDAADAALLRLAEGARADGDATFAAFVAERRRFLQEVRAALEE